MKTLIMTLALVSFSALAKPVTLKFDKTANKAGKIYYLVFNDARSFPDRPAKAIKNGIVPVSAGQSAVETTIDLPLGSYAISVFLDENGNGKLDTGLFGIPKERFGFSNNPTITTGAPTFQEAEIEVTESSQRFTINLMKLF
jgi:uncharacterized protein (DUF2141 family)